MSQKIARSQPRLRLEKTAPVLRSHQIPQLVEKYSKRVCPWSKRTSCFPFLKANGTNVTENSEVSTQNPPWKDSICIEITPSPSCGKKYSKKVCHCSKRTSCYPFLKTNGPNVMENSEVPTQTLPLKDSTWIEIAHSPSCGKTYSEKVCQCSKRTSC